MPSVYTRLRIRNADDTADDLIVSDLAGHGFPYLKGAPEGDGTKLNTITCQMEIGAYVARLTDVETAPGVRVLTSKLADASGRPALLDRRAYWEESEDSGASWPTVVAGYVTGIVLENALVAGIEIGETRRMEERVIWESLLISTPTGERVSSFDQYCCLIGGPVRGGFGPLRDLGGWRFQVASTQATTTETLVTLALVRGRLSPSDAKAFGMPETFTSMSAALKLWLNRSAWPYLTVRASRPDWRGGKYGGLVARLTAVATGTVLPNYMHPAPAAHSTPAAASQAIVSDSGSSITLRWVGTLPSVSDQFDIYVFPYETTDRNPLHIEGHPVEVMAAVFDEIGQEYVAASVATCKAAVGPYVVSYRAIRGYSVKEIGEHLYAAFAFGTRPSAAGGALEFVKVRQKVAAAPSVTIALSDFVSKDARIYDLQQSSVVNSVVFEQDYYYEWTEDDDVERPADGLLVRQQRHTHEVEGIVSYKRVTISLPAQVSAIKFDPAAPRGITAIDYVQFGTALAEDLFNRFRTGAPASEVILKRGAGDQIAEFVILDVPHLPNGVVRGGPRIMQVVQASPARSRVRFGLLDAGANVQQATVPTFTLALDADDPLHRANATITNAAALVLAGAKVRVELVANEATTPTGDGALLAIVDPAVTTVIPTPPQSAGTVLWLRMQAIREDERPTAPGAWSSITLTALVAPSGHSRTGNLHSWTVGEAGVPVEVLWRLAAEAATEDRLAATLPPGSTQYDFTGIVPASTSITVTIRHREAPPYGGVSSAITATYTTPGTGSLNPPTNPQGFAFAGTYGLRVDAGETADTEFEEAIEDSPGAGTFGSYVLVATESPTAQPEYNSTAPNDGKLRRLRARHVAGGATPSAYTTPVDVDPWGV